MLSPSNNTDPSSLHSAARSALRHLEPELAKRYEQEDARLMADDNIDLDTLGSDKINALHVQRQHMKEQVRCSLFPLIFLQSELTGLSLAAFPAIPSPSNRCRSLH
jgi:hypothetical protein